MAVMEYKEVLKRMRLRRLIGFIIICLCCPPLYAGIHSSFGSTLLYNKTFDSNLFRIPESNTDSSLHKSVFINTVGGNVNGEVEVSRQKFRWNANLYNVEYEGYKYLNYISGFGDFKWDWLYAKRLSGYIQVGAERRKNTSDEYIYVDNKILRRSIKSRVEYSIGSDRYLSLVVKLTDVENSNPNLQAVNRLVRTFRLSTFQRNEANTEGGLYYETRLGEFPDRDLTNVSFLDDRFIQTSGGAYANFYPTRRVFVKTTAGLTMREYNRPGVRGYQGWVAGLYSRWNMTDKINISANIDRDIKTVEEENSNYYVVDSAQLEGEWRLTYKISIFSSISMQRRNYNVYNSLGEKNDTL
ncbi:MAG: hypothetical protein R3240_12490, partial [Gammaproteobacteria bacterium]|nr:hypothetical protein [Gammaproteobacteria bacterium]